MKQRSFRPSAIGVVFEFIFLVGISAQSYGDAGSVVDQVGVGADARSQIFSEEISGRQEKKITIEVISRPVFDWQGKPGTSRDLRHYAVISEELPHGRWEAGPDPIIGFVATTNTTNSLDIWFVSRATSNAIAFRGADVRSKRMKVNQKGLINAIKLFEETFSSERYVLHCLDSEYAVRTVIYGAGGQMLRKNDF